MVPRRASRIRARPFDFRDGFRLPRHTHGTGQFDYAAAGVMTVTTHDAAYLLPPQRALWIPPGVPHDALMHGDVAMRTIYLHPDDCADMPSACCVVSVSPLLRELILAAMEVREPPEPGSRDERLYAVLLDEIRRAPSTAAWLPLPQTAHLRAFADDLRTDPQSRATIEEHAGGLGLSPRTLGRQFVRETGMTFGAWRQHARLMAAMRLLAAGEPVTTAALQSGYSSPSAFIAMFRRVMGMSPGRYFGQYGRG